MNESNMTTLNVNWRPGQNPCWLSGVMSIHGLIKTRLDALLQTGLSLVDAVYKLRNGFIGFRGDVVFAYKRTQRESH